MPYAGSMIMESLAIPPLPVLEICGADRYARLLHPGNGIFPTELERQLAGIVQETIRVGVAPAFASAEALPDDGAKTLLATLYPAFEAQRRQIWPLIVNYIQHNPVVLLRLLREVSSLARVERLRIPVHPLDDGDPRTHSLLRLGLALRTYEMTLDLALRSLPSVLATLSTGRVLAEFAEPAAFASFCEQLDAATARLEFGTLVALGLLERPNSTRSPLLDVSTQYAQEGADQQHVLVRGVLRSIMGDGVTDGREIPHAADSANELPPEAILADWVRAVLAA